MLKRWSEEYGLFKIARYQGDLQFKEVSDLIESFVGALVVVFDNIVGKGYGFVISYNWFTTIIQNEKENKIDFSKAYEKYKDSVSKLKDFGDFFGDKKISLNQKTDRYGTYIVKYYLNNIEIGSGISKSDKQTAKEALNKLGVTDDILLKYTNHPLYSKTNDYFKNLRFYMSKNNILDFDINVEKLNDDTYKTTLYVKDKNNTKIKKGTAIGLTKEISLNSAVNSMLNL